MTKPLLSILIPLTPDRMEISGMLINKICGSRLHQTNIAVKNDSYVTVYTFADLELEIITWLDNKIMTIGEKRDKMYKLSSGLYSWQIDSDDMIADDAISIIIEAIKSSPEISCITFRENCMMNGVYKSSNHSLKYYQWMDNQDGYDYVRSPFYKDVIRTDIAQSVPFEYIRYNEDERWSRAIYPLLKDEIHIDKELYFYVYEPKESHEERYGLNR